MTRVLFVAVASLISPALFAETILLQSGQETRFTMPGNCVIKGNVPAPCFTNDLAIDVPASARQLRLELDGGGADVDLLVRYGAPFPTTGNAGTFGGLRWLQEHAHYHSISLGTSERLTITRKQLQPLRAGRWHLSILNYSGQSADVRVTATLENGEPGPVPLMVDFNDEAACTSRQATTAPWFDGTAVSPIAGNPGTTRGEQRRNAFMHALERVREQLTGTAPLRILACWRALGHADGDPLRATLASAGPLFLVRNNSYIGPTGGTQPFLNKSHTWYPAPAAAQRAGTDRCRHSGGSCGNADIFIQFNTDVDGTVVLGNSTFHYGYQPPGTGSNTIDFVTTTMHEIVHGLGFIGLTGIGPDNLGEKFLGYDDIYTDAAVYTPPGGPVTPINRLDNQQRAAALTSLTHLRWIASDAVGTMLNPWFGRTFPDNLPRLYAPNPPEGGASLSHLSSFGQPDQLMSPFAINGLRSLGLARPMLAPIGWQQNDQPAPVYEQPYGGNWFDPARDGHGIDLHRVSGLPDTYFLVFYTFDADGLPEWYLSIGRIVDGVFRPGDDDSGSSLGDASSLWRVRYVPGSPPTQEVDTSVRGQIRIDFDQGERAPECDDGVGRNAPLALMSFSITPRNQAEQRLRWCMTQIVPESARPAFDRTGHWFAGDADAGWGLTTLGFGNDGKGLFAVLYYPDSEGRPRWAATQNLDFQSGAEMPVFQIQGYCRTCPKPAGNLTSTQIGRMRLSLEPPEGSDGELSFEVEFDGPGGGRFERAPLSLFRLAESSPDD